MLPLALILSALTPDVSRLGADEYRVREAETRRCDNPLSAALLPNATDDPEVNARIAYLKQRHRPLTQRQIERRVMREDFPRWVEQYLVLNRSAFARDFEFYRDEFLNHPEHYGPIFGTWPVPGHQRWNFWAGALLSRDYPEYLDYLDYHHGIAPPPRAREP